MRRISAAIAEPAAVAVRAAAAEPAVNRAGFKNGADGVIVGAGPIGLLALQAFKAAGGGRAMCVCVDISSKRPEIALKLAHYVLKLIKQAKKGVMFCRHRAETGKITGKTSTALRITKTRKAGQAGNPA